jgi:hypothetical protein
MPRVTTETARELIKHVKSLNVHLWIKQESRGCTAAYTFFRQMDSSKLYKINPEYKATLHLHHDDVPARLIAEYNDGSKWERTVDERTTFVDLRSEFFEGAEYVADKVELEGDEALEGDDEPEDEATFDADEFQIQTAQKPQGTKKGSKGDKEDKSDEKAAEKKVTEKAASDKGGKKPEKKK